MQVLVCQTRGTNEAPRVSRHLAGPQNGRMLTVERCCKWSRLRDLEGPKVDCISCLMIDHLYCIFRIVDVRGRRIPTTTSCTYPVLDTAPELRDPWRHASDAFDSIKREIWIPVDGRPPWISKENRSTKVTDITKHINRHRPPSRFISYYPNNLCFGWVLPSWISNRRVKIFLASSISTAFPLAIATLFVSRSSHVSARVET